MMRTMAEAVEIGSVMMMTKMVMMRLPVPVASHTGGLTEAPRARRRDDGKQRSSLLRRVWKLRRTLMLLLPSPRAKPCQRRGLMAHRGRSRLGLVGGSKGAAVAAVERRAVAGVGIPRAGRRRVVGLEEERVAEPPFIISAACIIISSAISSAACRVCPRHARSHPSKG